MLTPLQNILMECVQLGGTAVFLRAASVPTFRVGTEIVESSGEKMNADAMDALLEPVLSQNLRSEIYRFGGCEIPFSLETGELRCDFRLTILQQLGRLGLVARMVGHESIAG